jgi:choline kinase
MRVIVPAAGCGRRLLPYTARHPKCLLRVGGVTIVERLLSQLVGAGVNEVVCVVGYEAEQVERHVSRLARRPPVRFVRNPDYASTNSIVSVLATAELWDRDFAIVDSDVVVSTRLLHELLAAEGNALVVDTSRPPHEVDMAAELRDGRVWHLGKDMPFERVSGEALPLSRWSVAGGARLRRAATELVRAGATDVWYQYAIREVAKELAIAPLHARPGEWLELDCPADLEAASRSAPPPRRVA